jgi:hypothetical protein
MGLTTPMVPRAAADSSTLVILTELADGIADPRGGDPEFQWFLGESALR